MKNKSKLPGILFFVGSLLFLHTLSANAFIDGNFAQAKEKAKLEHKMLLVKFTAKWCLPCKWMDKTVFQDSQVIEFLDDKIVGISVDVDDSEGVASNLNTRLNYYPPCFYFILKATYWIEK
ncbi:MAG: thioredoxin family protein [Saprospiraceae bacterium]|nr:thioredoxin family protein [Candidatus Defluviibacterium haderslevense]